MVNTIMMNASIIGIAFILITFKSAYHVNAHGHVSIRSSKQQDAFKFVCYMTNWAQYRPTDTKFTPNDIDPDLCTHLIFAFAAINTTSWEIRAFEWNDETTEEGAKADPPRLGRYEELNNLKLVNPELKTLLAVGGWNMGTKPFSDMARNKKHRRAFIDSSVRFLRKWEFDGLDLDWEFPAKRDGSRKEDRESFTHLVRELRETFYQEAKETKQEQLLLTTAVAQEKNTILNAYDIVNIVAHLDFINVMSYDYHGSWDSKCGHNSPLYAARGADEKDQTLTVDWTIRLYLTLGVPLEKLILGIPFYGRSFTLKNKKERKFGSKTIGDGIPGEATRERGFLSYGFEICKYIKEEKWTRGWSKSQQVPFAFKANQWVGYDDEDSINVKVDYIIDHCLGGAMVWSIDLDDFKGFCSNQTFPLSRLIGKSINGVNRERCKSLSRIVDPDVQKYLETVTMMPFAVHKPLPSRKKIAYTKSPKTIHTKPSRKPFSTRFEKLQGTRSRKEMKKTTASYKKNISSNKNLAIFYEKKKDQNEKLNTILMAYKSSRKEKKNEDIVDSWLKSLISGMTSEAAKATTKTITRVHTRPVLVRRPNKNRYPKSTTKRRTTTTKRRTTTTKQPTTTFKVFTTKPKTTTKAPTTTKRQRQHSRKKFPRKNSKKLKKKEDDVNYCDDREDGEFVRDPNDCSSFYTCYMGGLAIKTSCGAGLMFDLTCSCCNWPTQVTC